MSYLIIGTILSLGGVGLIMSKISVPGIVLLLIGVFIGLKGRSEIDRK